MQPNHQGMQLSTNLAAFRPIQTRPASRQPGFALPREAERMEAIGRFASEIVHDFNSVLAAIVVYAEMIVRQAHDPRQKQCGERMVAAAARGRGLVAQLLAYVRTESAGLRPIDACASTAEAVEMVRSLAPAHIAVDAAIHAGPLMIMSDTTQLGQVVTNLCNNAIHAMPDGGRLRVTLEPAQLTSRRDLSHGTVKPGRYALLRIEDDGCGMDKATRTRAFEPFFTTRTNGKGTGLGLSIVQSLVARFSGALDMWSAPGRGTRFSIYVPLTGERG